MRATHGLTRKRLIATHTVLRVEVQVTQSFQSEPRP